MRNEGRKEIINDQGMGEWKIRAGGDHLRGPLLGYCFIFANKSVLASSP